MVVEEHTLSTVKLVPFEEITVCLILNRGGDCVITGSVRDFIELDSNVFAYLVQRLVIEHEEVAKKIIWVFIFVREPVVLNGAEQQLKDERKGKELITDGDLHGCRETRKVNYILKHQGLILHWRVTREMREVYDQRVKHC